MIGTELLERGELGELHSAAAAATVVGVPLEVTRERVIQPSPFRVCYRHPRVCQ